MAHHSGTTGAPVTLILPFPPSVNNYWRWGSGRMYIHPDGLTFRTLVLAEVHNTRFKPIVGPVDMRIDMFPKKSRKHDIDNVFKALCDALTHARR